MSRPGRPRASVKRRLSRHTSSRVVRLREGAATNYHHGACLVWASAHVFNGHACAYVIPELPPCEPFDSEILVDRLSAVLNVVSLVR